MKEAQTVTTVDNDQLDFLSGVVERAEAYFVQHIRLEAAAGRLGRLYGNGIGTPHFARMTV